MRIVRNGVECLLVIVLLLAIDSANGQQKANVPQRAGTPQTANPNTVFQPYTTCKFGDGLQVVDTSPLALGVTTRTVPTMNGTSDVEVLAGRRVLFSYPDKDYYANVKVEVLSGKNYADEKQALIGNFDYLLATGKGNGRNYELKPTMHGLDVRGLDRDSLEGAVIGYYLLFDDSLHVATTIYFLNQEPSVRSFQTMEEYREMRDRFLATYTVCAAPKQDIAPMPGVLPKPRPK
ncbi:MAG: hypothetical protein WDN23_12425 [Edaphobacter sp.]